MDAFLTPGAMFNHGSIKVIEEALAEAEAEQSSADNTVADSEDSTPE